MTEPRPSYEAVQASLGGAEALLSPAELQGLLLGMFCAKGPNLSEQVTLANCFASGVSVSPNQQRVLHALVANTRDDLVHFNFAIPLLLPEADQIDKRASEFIRWCQGFLQGLGSASEQMMQDADAIDALKHIAETAQIDLTELDVSDDDEACLFNVTEYVRLAVLAIYADLKAGHDSGMQSTMSYH